MDPVLVERDEGVVTVTLNRPQKKNAVDAGMVRALRSVLDEVAITPADRVLVLPGAGAAFCTGAALTDERPPKPAPTANQGTSAATTADVGVDAAADVAAPAATGAGA